jgi:glutathione synthase/RimK-type ligase-like ATP-grasp enzyme
MRTRIYPYHNSLGARALSELADVTLLRSEGTQFHPRAGDTIINWGRSDMPQDFFQEGVKVLNKPDKVSVASSKLATLTQLKESGINVPKFTTDREQVAEWLSRNKRVVVRRYDRAASGRGITLLETPTLADNVPRAQLYTLYRPKRHEYRVHLWRNQETGNLEVLDIQQKRKRLNFPQEQFNASIRCFSFGWVFCRGGVECPDSVVVQALGACNALGLDFGACDIGFEVGRQIATVYEVNTAPGLVNTTAQKYAERFAALKQNR